MPYYCCVRTYIQFWRKKIIRKLSISFLLLFLLPSFTFIYISAYVQPHLPMKRISIFFIHFFTYTHESLSLTLLTHFSQHPKNAKKNFLCLSSLFLSLLILMLFTFFFCLMGFFLKWTKWSGNWRQSSPSWIELNISTKVKWRERGIAAVKNQIKATKKNKINLMTEINATHSSFSYSPVI